MFSMAREGRTPGCCQDAFNDPEEGNHQGPDYCRLVLTWPYLGFDKGMCHHLEELELPPPPPKE